MDPSTPTHAPNAEPQDDIEEPARMDQSQSLSSLEHCQENTEPTSYSPTATPQYYSVMEDEVPDEVFTQPPFLPFRMEPEGGSTCQAPATSPSVSLRSSDATAANTNPECLDWHHGERQLMAIHSQVREEMENTVAHLGEAVRRSSSGGIQCTEQDRELMEDSIIQGCEEKDEERTPEDKMVELKSLVDMELLEETGLTRTCLNLEGHNLLCPDLENVTEDNQSKMDAIDPSPASSDEDGIDSELVDVRSLDSELKEYDWVKRTSVEDVEEVVSIEHRELHDQEEVEETQSSKDSRIATEILQGEDLLQRLQLVQQRQDLEVGLISKDVAREDPEIVQEIQKQEQAQQEPNVETSVLTATEHFDQWSIHKAEVISYNDENDAIKFVNLKETSVDEDDCKHLEQESESTATQIVATDQLTKDRGSEDQCCKAEGALEEEQTCAEENYDSSNEDDNQEAQERTFLPISSHQKTDSKDNNIEETDSWTNEKKLSFPACHRLSAAETCMEKQFQEALKRDLQRAEGVFDLSDDPDVLEIPFKSNISLEPLPTIDDPVQSGEWHFSEQKMHKEISQEMQRELVLVNLGKIPGGYSKGESRQMKVTKLLFEEFHQDKTEGPTRVRKPQTSKSQIYPSVLERTRSLEMLSNKMTPMLRTHSFRLMSPSEKEKHPETFRSQSPSLRDKARLSPYPKHEKAQRKHKSMDTISMTSSTTSVDRVRNSREESVREGSPLLKENPFFKLRPALSLQPEVEKDIREAKKREEELRKQRSSLYGETRQVSKEDGKSTGQLKTDSKQKTTGRLERVWPPPSKKDPTKAEQQEARVQRVPGHRAALWQQWETGQINGQTPRGNNSN